MEQTENGAEARDFLVNNGLVSILETVRKLSKSQIRELSPVIDKESRWPEENIRALQAAGLGGLVIDQSMGGLGQGLAGLARVCELLGQSCASTGISFGMHCVGSAVLSAQPTQHQIDTFLKPISEGNHLTSLALSEPGTGAHFYFPGCSSSLQDDGTLEIEGTKCFVTNGAHADSYVVSTGHTGEDEVPHFSCIVVDNNLDGMTWANKWTGFGMRGNSSVGLQLDRVSVPGANLLGHVGDQTWYVFNIVMPYFLMAMSGVYMGVAGAAMDEVRTHLMNRVHSHTGSPLSELPLIQQKYATLSGKLESMRHLVLGAAQQFDDKEENAVVAIMLAKAEVAETATMIVNEAMTMMGGIAYRDGTRIQQLLRDVRASHVMAPTTDLLHLWAGRMLLDQPVLGD